MGTLPLVPVAAYAARPTLHADTDVMQTMPVVLNSDLSVKAKP